MLWPLAREWRWASCDTGQQAAALGEERLAAADARSACLHAQISLEGVPFFPRYKELANTFLIWTCLQLVARRQVPPPQLEPRLIKYN